MWAMIASSIALIVWTTGLTYLTHKEDQRRVLHAQEAEAGSVTKGTDGKDDGNV